MATDIYSIDQLYPTFTGNETNAEKIAMIMDYLYQLIESLKYTLYHLDEGNFSEGALNQKPDMTGYVTDDELTEELDGYVKDTELTTALTPYAKKTDLSDYVPKLAQGNTVIEADYAQGDISTGKIILDADNSVEINCGTVSIYANGGLWVNGQRIG